MDKDYREGNASFVEIFVASLISNKESHSSLKSS